MKDFNIDDIIEVDALNEVFLIKQFQIDGFEFFVKIDENIKFDELKIKKESIEFFTSQKNFKNPLACEFNIVIFTKTQKIFLEATSNNKKKIEEIFDLLKTILL